MVRFKDNKKLCGPGDTLRHLSSSLLQVQRNSATMKVQMAPPRKSRFPALPLAMKPMEVAERTEIPEAVSGAYSPNGALRIPPYLATE